MTCNRTIVTVWIYFIISFLFFVFLFHSRVNCFTIVIFRATGPMHISIHQTAHQFLEANHHHTIAMSVVPMQMVMQIPKYAIFWPFLLYNLCMMTIIMITIKYTYFYLLFTFIPFTNQMFQIFLANICIGQMQIISSFFINKMRTIFFDLGE